MRKVSEKFTQPVTKLTADSRCSGRDEENGGEEGKGKHSEELLLVSVRQIAAKVCRHRWVKIRSLIKKIKSISMMLIIVMI